jgi:predicted Rossmann-fold nucleotide-binding protein
MKVVIVCGGRDYVPSRYDRQILITLLDYLAAELVMQGGASGVDTWAAEVAAMQQYQIETMRPDYDHYASKRAPLVRNYEMAQAAKPNGVCIAFPGGTGTAHMVRAARQNSLRIIDLR